MKHTVDSVSGLEEVLENGLDSVGIHYLPEAKIEETAVAINGEEV